jgi:hypothetical protein
MRYMDEELIQSNFEETMEEIEKEFYDILSKRQEISDFESKLCVYSPQFLRIT